MKTSSILVVLASTLFLGLAAKGQVRLTHGEQVPVARPLFPSAKLTGTDTQTLSTLGFAVAANGDTIVAGAPGGTDGEGHFVYGAVYVYTKPAGGWQDMTQVAKLTGSDEDFLSFFGGSVAVSGNTIVVSSNLAEVYVFVKPADGWKDMTETALLKDSSSAACLCAEVGVQGDTVIVGSPFDETNSGSIEVFVKPAGGWRSTNTPDATLTQPAPQAEDQPFRGVSISGDTIVGGGFSGGQGYAFLFDKPEGGWHGNLKPTATLSSTVFLANSAVGTVSISGDTVVSGPSTVDGTYVPASLDVWTKPTGGWVDMTETALLTDTNLSFADGYGFASAVAGNKVVVGKPFAFSPTQQPPGEAISFHKPAGGWQSTTKHNGQFLESDYNAPDGFAFSLAASGSVVAVGAQDNGGGGAVFVFEK